MSRILKTGQSNSSTLTVKSNGAPLRIALAYSDPPGPALVNNLNHRDRDGITKCAERQA